MSLSGPPKRRPWVWGIGAIVLAVVVLLLYRNGTEPSAWLAKLKPMTEPAVGASAAAASGASAADAPAEASGDAPGAASDTQAPADTNANAAAPAAGSATASAQSPAPAASSPAAQTLAAVAGAGSTPGAASAAAATAGASASAKAAAAAAASAPPEPAEGQQSIHISVSADSWVSVKDATGKEVLSGLMHSGDAKDAVGKPPLQFVIGNNKGVDSLEVNGAAVDPSKYANAKGNVARFTLP
jgi:cytoskeleton protein RodZ